jgi:TonB-dependent receptor
VLFKQLIMNKITRSIHTLTALSAALLCSAAAQAAILTGYVLDTDNSIYLEGTRVVIRGTPFSTVTERGGLYRFRNVPPGNYTVTAEATGLPVSAQDITVANDYDQLTLNFNLSREDVIELEEFVVEGTLIGTAKSLDIRRTATDYREVVSSDAFGQFTDRNPAEALQRVAGITTESDHGDGAFLIIRGGDPSLSAVMIDGVELATPREDGRTINLNVITVDQLERIEVSKTWLPSMKGGVIAGRVDMITRSALDRGQRFASADFANTFRQNQEDSHRWSFTYGDLIDSRTWSWLGDMAIGLQFSVNQSMDYSGSQRVSYNWNTYLMFPWLTRPEETRPWGYSIGRLDMRDYNIERKREGASVRLEFRINKNHEIYASYSRNKFDDVINRHLFSMHQTTSAMAYIGENTAAYGTIKYFTPAMAELLGSDLNDPFNANRLSLPPTSQNKLLTFNEVFQLDREHGIGQMQFDPVNKIFTKGGVWGTLYGRTFEREYREDTIDTRQIGGQHKLPWAVDMSWKAYASEARADTEIIGTNFDTYSYSGAGAVAMTGAGVKYPYFKDQTQGALPVMYVKTNFTLRPDVTGESTRRTRDLTTSTDDRSGADIDLTKSFDIGSSTWRTRVGYALDQRDKSYKVDNNNYGIRMADVDRTIWPLGYMSLEDDLFDGGEVVDFTRNFGPDLPFGPTFNQDGVVAFLSHPTGEPYGVKWFQSDREINNNLIARVRSEYQAEEKITGYYLQQEVNWRKWSFIFGARYEVTDNTFTNLYYLTRNPDLPKITFIPPSLWRLLAKTYGDSSFTELTTSTRDYHHLLPALHVIRQVGENTTVRASASRTIARPLFTDLIPREIPSIEGGSTYGVNLQLPNFGLMPMESINYDLSIDHYLKPIGLFSIGLFYKDLDGPIYEEVRPGVGPNKETEYWELKYNSRNAQWKQPGDRIFNDRSYTFTQMRNSGKGELMGFEVTFDRRFTFLPDLLNGFGINSNIAFFDSYATLVTQYRVGEKVRLFRQPDMTANLSLYYERKGLYARLSYNLRGEYLQSVAGGTATLSDLERIGDPLSAADIFVEPVGRWDFILRLRITRSLQAFFSVINITDEKESRYIGSTARPFSVDFVGKTFNIGAQWNL